MPSKHVRFDNGRGAELAGILDLPPFPPVALALFAHCFTCSKNLKAAAHVSRALNDAGIGVLRFDFTGLGQSEGDFGATTFASNVDDLVAACRFLEREHEAPALLVGHSLGGAAVLEAAAKLPAVTAVATIGAPSTPAHVRRMFGDALDGLQAGDHAEVELGGRSFRIRKGFMDDLDEQGLPESLASLRRALLILHAPLDDVVDIDNASELFLNAKHPKSFVSLDEADHLLTREQDSLYAGRVLAAWASRYLPARDESAAVSGDVNETVARTAAGGFRTVLSVAGHPMVADEPESYGGTNAGPSPYDLLAAALASCTSMTLRLYADRKKLDLAAVTARVRHDKVHAKDCADCEAREGKIDVFERRLAFDGSLGSDEKKRLLEIADRCPVHRSLHGEIKVRTSLDRA